MTALLQLYFLAGLVVMNFMFTFSDDFRLAILKSPLASFIFWPGLIASLFFFNDENDA